MLRENRPFAGIQCLRTTTRRRAATWLTVLAAGVAGGCGSHAADRAHHRSSVESAKSGASSDSVAAVATDLTGQSKSTSTAGPRDVMLSNCRDPDGQVPPEFHDTTPWAVAEGRGAGDTVPLRTGLMVVTAVATPDGDYESFKTVAGLSDSAETLAITVDRPEISDTTGKPVTRRDYAARVVPRHDVDAACGYGPEFMTRSIPGPPDTLAGTTAITFSPRMVSALKTGKDQYLRIMRLDATGKWVDFGDWMHLGSPRPVMLPLILNNQPVTLPAISAACDPDSNIVQGSRGDTTLKVLRPCEYYVLDDPADPIVLMWRSMRSVGGFDCRDTVVAHRNLPYCMKWQLDTTQLQVVKIGYVTLDPKVAASDEHAIEDSLAQRRKVVIYGIYFDFAKSDIKKESAPVLREIADVMQKHPGWALTINGYTDSIGGDAYNLALSKHRAAAVKDTLMSGYHIAGGRLTSAGYGAASPADSNSTLEGRARNRRVELVRGE
jgi:outer membrane protein OmpA-like peptidoglycan-associated protein